MTRRSSRPCQSLFVLSLFRVFAIHAADACLYPRHYGYAALVLLLCLSWPYAVRAAAPGENKDLAANAALYYWQAIQAMPTLDAETEKRLADWKAGPPTPDIQTLLDKHEPALVQLHRGAKYPRCEWGLDYDQGIYMLLQSTQQMSALTKRAGWRARGHFEAGRHQAGVDDIIAALTAARHVGSDPILVSTQVQYAMENRTIEDVAPYLTTIDQAARTSLVSRLQSLPKGSNLQTVVRAEKDLYLGWIIRRLKSIPQDQPEEFKKFLLVCFDHDDFQTRLAAAAGSPPSREKVIALLEATLPVYDETAELVALSWRDWPARLSAFEERIRAARATNPFYEPWMLNLSKIRGREAKNIALWAMFKAALAVADQGEGALKNHPDPYGPSSLEYQPLNPGFQLKSKLDTQTDPPATLTTGQRKPN
jgi:hypothetical protein